MKQNSSWTNRPDGLRRRPRLHGHVGLLRARRRGREHATIRAALDAGVTLLDTGDFYGMGHNEMLIAATLRDVPRERYLLSVKFGALRGPDGQFLGFDLRPDAIKTALAYSLKRLGTDYIDIYRPSRLDPAVPIEDAIGALAELVKAGYVRHIGLSEVGVDTIRRAHATHPICDLQIEYSLMSRGVEADILPALRELGIALTAYGILSRGLIGGAGKATGGFRSHLPRFQGENLRAQSRAGGRAGSDRPRQGRDRLAACDRVGHVARRRYRPAGRRAPAHAARRQPRGRALSLTETDLARIEAAMPASRVAGDRYPAQFMTMLDSERRMAS